MRFFAVLISFATLVFSSSASAAENWVCDEARDNASLLQCADGEFRKYDAELNRIYAVLMKDAATMSAPQSGYGAPPVQALRNAQRAWIAFRDSNCHWKATAFYGGTGQAVIMANCRAIATRDRVDEFKEFQEN